jgi:preprotein translocase subunit YajC
MISLPHVFSSLSAVAATAIQGGSAGSAGLNMLLAYAAIFALFYFLFIRPGQKQRKAHEERIRQVKRGEEVVTAGGVIGEVVHIRENVKDGAPVPTMEDRITIKSADARIIVERRAIARILSPAVIEEEKPK